MHASDDTVRDGMWHLKHVNIKLGVIYFMNKKQKKLEKALKLAGFDKEKFDDVLVLLSDDVEDEEKEKEDEKVEKDKEQPATEGIEVKEKKEIPKEKEEVKQETKKEEISFEAILEKLTKLEKVLTSHEEVIKDVEKSKPIGAKPKDTSTSKDDEVDFDAVFRKYNR